MGTISSGVGLISGLDIRSIVDQLIAIEARPRDMLLRRMGNIDAQRTAYLDLSARIGSIVSRLDTLTRADFFRSVQVASSDSSVLTATAEGSVPPGSYSFRVLQLATTQQLVSRGFAGTDSPLDAGVLTIETAAARTDTATRLDELNGFAGVERGRFVIRDGSGAEAEIDLADAVTINDVIDKINAAGIDVRASLRGDSIVLTETTGGTLRVLEVDGGHAARDLGFSGPTAFSDTGELVGADLVRLDGIVPLDRLNDGLGVRMVPAGADFSINGVEVDLSDVLKDTTRLGRLNHGAGVQLGTIRITLTDADGNETTTDVDLSGAQTVGDIKSAIEAAVPNVTVALTGGRLAITATGDAEGHAIRIEDVSGRAARDLGISGSSDDGNLRGRQVLFADTLADVLAAINYAENNDGSIQAAISDDRLVISSTSGSVDLVALNGSHALEDLGFAEGTTAGDATSRRLVGGLNTVLLRTLNGGRGFETGVIQIQLGTQSTTVDLTGAETLRDVLDAIRAAADDAGMNLDVGLDTTGRRIELTSVDGVTPVQVSDVSGSFAADTGLASSGVTVRSNDLQRQYVGETTRLRDLLGTAPQLGTLRITNSQGLVQTLDLTTGGSVETVGDLIERINSLDPSFGITARINDTGDGILIEDTAGGSEPLIIADDSGSLAEALHIAGSFDDGRADGSREIRIELSGGETLNDLISRINDADGPVRATLINDGGGVAPYRIQLTATRSGRAGEVLIDASSIGLEFSTLARAQDARVLMGDSGGVLITSSDNTLEDVVSGLTVELHDTSDGLVTLNVQQDVDSVVNALSGLVSDFNAAIDKIDELTAFDPETQQRGVLLGDATVRLVEQRLFSLLTRSGFAVGDIRRLSDLGIDFEDGKLSFDEQTFRDAYAADPDAVRQFLTDPDHGVAVRFKQSLEALSDPGGMLQKRTDILQRERESLNRRVELMNTRLDRSRERLMRQFIAMEQALAQLQSQQSALASLGGGGLLGGLMGM